MALAAGMRPLNLCDRALSQGPTDGKRVERVLRVPINCSDEYRAHMLVVDHWVDLSRSADSHSWTAQRLPPC